LYKKIQLQLRGRVHPLYKMHPGAL
jgi:hypothetical protein